MGKNKKQRQTFSKHVITQFWYLFFIHTAANFLDKFQARGFLELEKNVGDAIKKKTNIIDIVSMILSDTFCIKLIKLCLESSKILWGEALSVAVSRTKNKSNQIVIFYFLFSSQ